jgi:hypothetical protein
MSSHGSNCDTLLYIDRLGERVTKKKKVYNTLEEAISMAKKMNEKAKIEKDIKYMYKLNAYYCTVCFKFHIGKSKKLLSSL